ncbi:MAG: FISUMP domain-containing protein [Bacteroidales bacterium]|nr:FISUMP domain-containing protein [Bacteroidales bacterium]
MKKIIFTLLALVGTMSMNAQVLKVMKGDQVVATFSAEEADNFVFEEAPIGQGEATAEGIGNVKWVQLWENGPKFAVYNVGATSATEYGGYYAWGGTYNNNPALEGFTWTNDHNTGTVDLSGETDTATKLWGNNWRMPTSEELKALLDNCDVEWIDGSEKIYNNTNITGLLCTGKGDYSSNSVFLPAAGNYDYSENGVLGQGRYTYYWSSTAYLSDYAYYLYFDSGVQSVSYGTRRRGLPVRAVLKETPATTGTAEVNGSAGITGNKVNWVQLWEGGPKFAEFNVGATSATEYGGYYAWGGNQNKVDDHKSGTEALTGTDDTATKLWGENWRMPTKEEFSNLLAKCDVKWIDGSTEKYNNTTVTGLLCTGKGAYSSNSVFLPAAGYYRGGGVDFQGYDGVYWSSTPQESDRAYDLYFDSGQKCAGNSYRTDGFSVRAVLK